MATFEVDVRAAGLLSGLRNAEKRMAYVVANSLNKTAKDIQKAQRAHAEKIFTLRNKKEFILRQVAVIKFASVKKGINEVRISVGQKPNLLLAGYEAGEQRSPVKGKSSVAVPVIGGARPSLASPVSPDLFIRKLSFKAGRSSHGARAGVLVGLRGTLILPRVGIFQRVGRGALKALYFFVKPFRLPANLQWVATAQSVAARRFAGHLTDEVRDAIAYAFGKGLTK